MSGAAAPSPGQALPAEPPLDALGLALLQALAAEPPGTAVSLPRLGKHLQVGVSVLMRRLSLMGQARMGAVTGPGWVQVSQQGERWMATLTEAGRARIAGA